MGKITLIDLTSDDSECMGWDEDRVCGKKVEYIIKEDDICQECCYDCAYTYITEERNSIEETLRRREKLDKVKKDLEENKNIESFFKQT